MKKIILIAIALLTCISLTYAADDGDCKQVLSKDQFLSNRDKADETNDPVQFNLNKSIPKKAMEKAFDNLKLYCCDVQKLSTGLCTKTDDKHYPESIYLFDHILDVYLRRLDAKQKNDNGEDLLYSLDPDSDGLERRNFMIKRGNEVNGSLPLEMQKMYEKFWKATQFIEPYGDNIQSEKELWLSSVATAIKSYDTWTLYDKYNLACDISNYIVATKNFGSSVTAQEYKSCKSLTYTRIDNEKIYTQVVLMQKGEKLLGANMNAYLGTYFVRNKLSNLLQTMFNISTAFSEVNKAVQLTELCS